MIGVSVVESILFGKLYVEMFCDDYKFCVYMSKRLYETMYTYVCCISRRILYFFCNINWLSFYNRIKHIYFHKWKFNFLILNCFLYFSEKEEGPIDGKSITTNQRKQIQTMKTINIVPVQVYRKWYHNFWYLENCDFWLNSF